LIGKLDFRFAARTKRPEAVPIAGCHMFAKKMIYWLPRVFVAAFALSLFIPAPDFVADMSDAAFVVWLARIGWVVGLPLVFCAVLVLMARIGKRAAGSKPKSNR
jgi:hypothetical protein